MRRMTMTTVIMMVTIGRVMDKVSAVDGSSGKTLWGYSTQDKAVIYRSTSTLINRSSSGGISSTLASLPSRTPSLD